MKAESSAFIAIALLVVMTVSAWVTHVVVAIQYLTAGIESAAYAILLAVGVFVPPVGVIHGIGVWFGAW